MNARDALIQELKEWDGPEPSGRYYGKDADAIIAALRADPEALADLCGPMMAVAEHDEILALAVDTINETHRVEVAERVIASAGLVVQINGLKAEVARLTAENERLRAIPDQVAEEYPRIPRMTPGWHVALAEVNRRMAEQTEKETT